MFKTLKKVISPSLTSKLRLELYARKSGGYNIHRHIVSEIQWSSDITFAVYANGSGPEMYGDSSNLEPIYTFCKLKVDSIEEAFYRLTIEVKKAVSKYPQFIYFNRLRLLYDDAENYLKNGDKLSLPEKADMIRRTGNAHRASWKSDKHRVEPKIIYEKYSSNSWHISKIAPYDYTGHGLYGDKEDDWL